MSELRLDYHHAGVKNTCKDPDLEGNNNRLGKVSQRFFYESNSSTH